MSKTQPARGMRDFLPADVRKRNYVIGIIKEVYEKYGFEPLETPSVENLETLTGKYGEEGNQLMFKILKRGEKLREELTELTELQSSDNSVNSVNSPNLENSLSDLALRYDLTVPLARVVANYRHELPKFFKRYQIQPVWRADRPAKGRYREFYQCDVDAIGSSSMLVEAELISAVCEIFERLGFKDFVVHINNRKLLEGILIYSNVPVNQHVDALTALDKLDKIGTSGVLNELINRGVSENSANDLLASYQWLKNYDQVYADKSLWNKIVLDGSEKNLIGQNNSVGSEGIVELRQLISILESNNLSKNFELDPKLARGLSYYTGAIFEVVLTNGDFQGSIAGGGRYDGLIGMFGKEQIPAVGFSIGLERILFVMEERGMFPEDLTANPADVMITLWNEDAAGDALKLAGELRAEGLRVLVYPEADKLGKQFKYADSLGIPYVCILGDEELAEKKVSIKNLKTGEQETVARDEVINKTGK